MEASRYSVREKGRIVGYWDPEGARLQELSALRKM